MPTISVLSPAFNEAENLMLHTKNVLSAFDAYNIDGELILIDDASTDSTQQVIPNLVQDNRVRAFRMQQNSKKFGAMAVGIQQAVGSIIVMMDADLQDDPASLPIVLQAIEDGSDMAIGWRKYRQDSWKKKLTSQVSNRMANLLFGTNFHDMNASLKAVRLQAIQGIDIQKHCRFLPHLVQTNGFRVVEVIVEHHPRTHGTSKFGFWNRIHTLADIFFARFHTGTMQPLPQYTQY